MSRVLFAAVLMAFFSTASLAAKDPPRPHVIVLLADDLGWGDVGYHGGRIATPAIDELAKRSVRLEQFYVQPVCSPTRASLMTGRYPMRYGMQCGVIRPWAQHGLPLDETMLPQLLFQAGYATAICGKWHLGHLSREYLPTARGFARQYGHYNGALDYFTHIRDGGLDWHRNDETLRQEGYTTDLIGDEAVKILKHHDPSHPLFLYVPFNAPHAPLQAPQEYLDRYQKMQNKQRRTYAAMVTCMDTAIGRILLTLKEESYQNTLVIFCSDNGGIPRFGSNGRLRSGKGTLYEGGVRVPALAAWTEQLKAGDIVDQPIHVVDLLPTLCGLAGAKLPTGKALDGKNVWPVIRDGQASPDREIVHNVTPFHAALRQGPWKLIHNGHVGANATTAASDERWELFHLGDDPAEQRNLVDQKSDVLQQMKRRLAALVKESAPANIPPNQAPQGFQTPKVWGIFP